MVSFLTWFSWLASWEARAARERSEEGVRLHAFPESLTLANNLVSLGLSLLLCLLELLPDVDQMWELHLGGSGKW